MCISGYCEPYILLEAEDTKFIMSLPLECLYSISIFQEKPILDKATLPLLLSQTSLEIFHLATADRFTGTQIPLSSKNLVRPAAYLIKPK